jgi:putative peptidoglycan lipid II flippase
MDKGNLLRSLMNISGMTLVSRVLGFVRDMLTAQFFGAGVAMDAYVVASRLPNLLRRIFAEGAFSQAFVPVLAEYKLKKSIDETQKFVADIAGLLTLILMIVVILGMIFASFVVIITAPGFAHDPQKMALTSNLLKITFPYILFISLASLASGVLNTWRVFVVPAFTPALLNISMILFILCFRNYFHPPILALAWSMIIGGILQLGFQLPYLKKIGMPLIPKINFRDQAVWRVVKLMGPAIFAMSISQISILINQVFASWLPNGSMSWLYFADRLMEFPTGVLGVALGTILLPSLSRHASDRNIETFSKTLDWGVRLCLLLALPATVGLAIAAKPLTMTLFMHGKFNLFDVAMTTQAMIAYSIGLLGLILVKVFGPGFYANQNIKTPVKIALFVLLCTQVMNLIFIGPLKHAGLALAISLGACINAGCLCFLLIKRGMYIPQSGWKIFINKLLLAVMVMAGCLLLSMNFLPLNFAGQIYIRILSLSVLLLVAAISYFGMLYIMGFRVSHYVLSHDN